MCSRWWPLRLETRRERTWGGVNLGCAFRDLDGCVWGFGPSCALGGRHCVRVFSNESTLCMRWPEYWSFSFSIIPSKVIPGLISFRMDWLDLLAVQGTLKCGALSQSQASLSQPQASPGIPRLPHWAGKQLPPFTALLSTSISSCHPLHLILLWMKPPFYPFSIL